MICLSTQTQLPFYIKSISSMDQFINLISFFTKYILIITNADQYTIVVVVIVDGSPGK